MERLDQYLAFIREVEGLKSVVRTAWAADGRRESTAEHTWRLALLGELMAEFYPGLDRHKIVTLCLIHDLGELYGGDQCASDLPDPVEKRREEQAAVERIFSLLPRDRGAEYLALWTEYEEGSSPEARLVKALDKAETILQHNQGQTPPNFDYPFNLSYGKPYFEGDPVLEELRSVLDAETRRRMEERDSAFL